MTVVIAMKFNPEYVMGVADEEVTMYGPTARTSDISKKLYQFGDSHFFGSSGNVEFSNFILMDAEKNIEKNNASTGEYANIVAKDTHTLLDDYMQKYVFDYFDVTKDDLKLADSKIDPKLKDVAINKMNHIENDLVTNFVIAGIDKDRGAQIYKVPWEGKAGYRENYQAIGTGRDKADIIITDYLERLPPEKRENIKPSVGCRKMMEAVRSAWGNQGVGGRTQVIWVKKGDTDIHTLDSYRSNILQNVICAHQNKDLSERYRDAFFRNIIEENADKESMVKDFMKNVSHEKLAHLYLTKGLHK